MKRIYLAGLISTDYPQSLDWRREVTPRLAKHFEVLNPLRGMLNKSFVDGGLNHPDLSSKDITLRDRSDVLSSDIILAHLDTFGSPRPLTGTIAELAWAWEIHIPVIGVAETDNSLMRSHPFIVEFVAHYFNTLEESIRFVIAEYK